MLSMDVGTAVEFHVVCVSRFRMGLGVGYVHVESKEYLQRDTDRTIGASFTCMVMNREFITIQHAPYLPILN